MTTTSTSEQATPTAPEAATPTSDYGLLRWLVLATFIVILNETVMLNAIPRLQVEFGVSTRSAQWLTSAFMLTMAVVIPVTGWFLQRVTTRHAFATAMTTFCAGTLLCALAPTFGVLLVGRIVQAAGTAVMMPLLMTTLMTVVAERDRGRVMGNVTLAMSVAPALGPAISGVVLHLASWRWMFGLVLPVAVVIAVLGLRALTDVGEVRAGSLDVVSVVLAALGFGPFVYGLSQLGGDVRPAFVPWLALGVGVASLLAFVARQLRLQRRDGSEPLLDLRTLTRRTYAVALAVMSVAFMAMLGSMILLPLYLQTVHGMSELRSGLLVMPGGLAMGLLGPTVGRLFDRHGARPLVVPGALGMLVAMIGFTRVEADTSTWLILAGHVLLMVSLAALFTPVFTIGLGALPPELYSHGSSLLGTLQQVSAAAGTAVVVAVVSARSSGLLDDGVPPLLATVGGMEWGFGVGAILAALVAVLVWFLPRKAPDGAQHS